MPRPHESTVRSDSVILFQQSKDFIAFRLPAILDTCTLYGPTSHLPFFLPGQFDAYQIKWFKFDQTSKIWKRIFKYDVNDPYRQTSLLFSMWPDYDVDYFPKSHLRAKGRYRAYDKAYYGNYFSGSHVLDIERVTAADLGTYKITVFNLVRKVGNEAIIELRHEGEKNEKF